MAQNARFLRQTRGDLAHTCQTMQKNPKIVTAYYKTIIVESKK